MILSGCQLRGLHEHTLDMFVALFGKRGAHHLVGGALSSPKSPQYTSSILTGLIFGLMPALRANKSAIEETLRSRSRSITGNARRPLSGFVVCQIALSLVLLSAAGVLGRTLLRSASLNPGIDIRNALAARVALSPAALSNPDKVRAAWQELMESMRRVPAVQSVALTDIVPMREGGNVLGYRATATPPPPNQEAEAWLLQ